MAALVSPNWSYKCEALGFKHGRPHSLQVHWTLTKYYYYFLYIPSYHCGITIGKIIFNSISCMLSIRPKLRLTKEVCNRHYVTGVTGTLTRPSCLGSMSVLVGFFCPPSSHPFPTIIWTVIVTVIWTVILTVICTVIWNNT